MENTYQMDQMHREWQLLPLTTPTRCPMGTPQAKTTLNSSCQELENRGSTFWHKALIKTEKQLKPHTHASLADFLYALLHPSSIYSICAHSTTHYGYLTRNYLTLQANVLDSEYSCLQLLIEQFYFPAKAPLGTSEGNGKNVLHYSNASANKGSSAGGYKKHQGA